MANIDCDAQKCVHNANGLCHAAVVHVRGGPTSDETQIHCSTYSYLRPARHNHKEMLFEAGLDMSPTREKGQTTRVACNASRCTFFRDYECTVDHLHVADPEFTRRGLSECATFRPE